MLDFKEALKREIEFIELNPNEEDLLDDENYLLKRYIYALHDNGTELQKLIIEMLQTAKLIQR